MPWKPNFSNEYGQNTMPLKWLFIVAIFPLLLFLVPGVVEPYALWDPAVLNARAGGGGERTTRWCNMGWWKDTDIFPEAAEALARKLLGMAGDGGYRGGGSVLDIGHGAGDSLVLHLSQSTPPQTLLGLTSLSSDTEVAQGVVDGLWPNRSTNVELFTASAESKPGKDTSHPLAIDDNEARGSKGDTKASIPLPYDLIYILDSIYHYPPSLESFLATLRPTLSPSGLVVYTDILPPADISTFKAFILSYLLGVPFANLNSRPTTTEAYETALEEWGWGDAVVEDWSDGVWEGFSSNLKKRGKAWSLVGNVVERAHKEGWKFLGVRLRKTSLECVRERVNS